MENDAISWHWVKQIREELDTLGARLGFQVESLVMDLSASNVHPTLVARFRVVAAPPAPAVFEEGMEGHGHGSH